MSLRNHPILLFLLALFGLLDLAPPQLTRYRSPQSAPGALAATRTLSALDLSTVDPRPFRIYLPLPQR